MATLEKIRNKSVLLFVIIIVALLAFILGDFLTSGRTYFGDPTTVARAAGAKVEYQDYQSRLSRYSEQSRNQGYNYDNDMLSQQVISELLLEKLFQKEYEDLGIVVTDKEITEAMTGDNVHPAAAQTIAYLSQQLALPEPSGKQVYDAMMNPAKYGLPVEAGEQLRQIWSETEKNLEDQMLGQKFFRLVSGLFTANKLDAQSLYDDNAATRHLAYVSKPVNDISEEDVNFTDEDIKAYWATRKNDYKLTEELRAVDYIVVAIEPSQEDRLAASQAVEAAIAGLNSSEGTEAVNKDSRFVVTRNTSTLGKVRNNDLKKFLQEKEVGQAELIGRSGDSYTIAKLLSTSTGIDSINVTVIRAAEVSTLDSIAGLLNAGTAKFADVVDNTTVMGNDSVWTALEGVGMDEKTKSLLTNATVGKAFVVTDTIQGQPVSALYAVNRRHAPVNYYEVATIEYTVDPSNETLTKLSSDLRTYVSNNSSAADFSANAANAGYSVLTDQVGASSPRLGNNSDSRKFVKWAMEAKKGQVSPMFQDDKQSYLIAMAVTDIFDGDYLPWNSPAIKNQLRAQALNSKKADKLMADYAGKANDLAGYAKAMGLEVAEGSAAFTSPVLLNLGVNESALQGAVAAAEQGKLVGPVKGNRGVLVFEVKSVDTDNRPFNVDEYSARFNQTFGISRLNNPMPLLLGKEKIENKSLNFVVAPGE